MTSKEWFAVKTQTQIYQNLPRWDIASTISYMGWFSRPAISGQLDPHLTSVQHIAIQPIHGIVSITLIIEPNESKTSRILREPVPGDVDVSYVTIPLKQRLQLFGGDPIREVIHLQADHTLDVGGASRSIRVAPITSIIVPVAISAPTAAAAPFAAPTPSAHLFP